MSGSTLVSLLCSETIWTGSTLHKNELVSCVQGEADRTYVKGLEVYWENIVTMILVTMSSFVLSRAVISIKTFLVSKVIFEWSPLIIGGREQTVLLES